MNRRFQVVLLYLTAAFSLSAAGAQLRTPATFDGILGCEGCARSRLTLTLSKDGSYVLRRVNLEADRNPESRYEIGRWELKGDRLLLRSESAVEFTLTAGNLRSANGELRRKAQPTPLDGTLQLRGLYRNGKFEECITGKSFPIDSRAIAGIAPGARPGLLLLLGHLEGESLIVDRPLRFSPGETCAPAEQQGASPSSVLEGSWTLTELNGKPLPASVTRPPYVIFANGKVSGFAGCNSFGGSYRATPSSLRLGNLISTQMACMDASMGIEDAFLQALQNTTTTRRAGDMLELLSGERLIAKLRKR